MNVPIKALPLSVAAALVLLACGKEPPPPPAAAPAPPPLEVIKIGHVGPLTGSIAHLGKDNENGARLAVDEANAKGIEIGGKKVKFELLAEDDQGDPKVGTTVAQKLVDAKVVGIVGHLNSGVSIPASALYEQAGIPMISGSSTNPKLTEQGFKVTFRVVGRDDQQGPAVANYLLAEVKPKTVAVIDDATAYGEGLANEVENSLKAAGVKVLPREKGTDKTADWKAVLTKLKGKKPDVIFYGGMDATGGPLLKQARELGIKVPFSFGDGACTDKMGELAGTAADGLLCSQAGVPVEATSKKFREAYKGQFKIDPILYAPFTFDGVNILIEAMKKAGSSEPAKYLPELGKISYEGASGKVEFDAKGDRKDAEITIFTMTGGKITPLAIVKSGQAVKFEDFIKAAAEAAAAAPTPAPATVPAAPVAAAPAAAPAPATPAEVKK